jgi:hypothetical protein
VARNSLEGAGFTSLDLRVSRGVTLARGTSEPRTLTIGLDAFNVTNRVNYTTFVGTLGSPLFLQPIGARGARQLQLSARFTF